MAKTIMTGYEVEHPAPLAGAVPRWLLVTALLAAPIAWLVQLSVDYGLASHACFPRESPVPTGLTVSPAAWPGSFALIIAALVIACASTGASFWMWRRTRHEAPNGYGLVEGAEGRTRFLAVWGFWTGIWFALDILFGVIGFIEVSACGG
jgi:hypothetical protein